MKAHAPPLLDALKIPMAVDAYMTAASTLAANERTSRDVKPTLCVNHVRPLSVDRAIPAPPDPTSRAPAPVTAMAPDPAGSPVSIADHARPPFELIYTPAGVPPRNA
jgi:hypothetical protein